MRRAKLVAFWSLGGLFLLTSLAVIFLALAGDDFYRWALRQAIEGRLERQIRVDGSFAIDVGLEPAVSVTDVWIENAPWASHPEMARAKRIEVQVALPPLLSGSLLLPQLLVEGLELRLETSQGGENNWDMGGAQHDGGNGGDSREIFYPLIELVSLKDISVTHQDHSAGRETRILLDFLHKRQQALDAPFDVEGSGSLNARPFEITGTFGSIEEVLSAAAPYPIDLTLRSASLIVELTGTVEDINKVEGLDIALAGRTDSLGEVLTAFDVDLPLVGQASAAARFQGSLVDLAVENVDPGPRRAFRRRTASGRARCRHTKRRRLGPRASPPRLAVTGLRRFVEPRFGLEWGLRRSWYTRSHGLGQGQLVGAGDRRGDGTAGPRQRCGTVARGPRPTGARRARSGEHDA